MNAIITTMFRAAEMRRSEKLAHICDYIRSKADPAAYLNDSLCVGDCKYPIAQKQEALDLLALIEAGEMEQVGKYFVAKLLADYGSKSEAV